jgi:hypothetical protein
MYTVWSGHNQRALAVMMETAAQSQLKGKTRQKTVGILKAKLWTKSMTKNNEMRYKGYSSTML